MRLLRSVVMAFSMFSRVPMPRVEWKDENMEYMLASLPLVGLALSVVLFIWYSLCAALSFNTLLTAAGFTVLPVLFTGGVHMDGFCDVTDALASHAELERKRQILKDSHAGAFAVIYVCVYFLSVFALYAQLPRELDCYMAVFLIPVLSRVCSGFAGICFPMCASRGTLSTFSGAAKKRPAVMILVIWAVLTGAAMLLLGPLPGVAALAAGALCCLYVRLMSMRQFGGMSGDLAGFLLQISELAMLAALVIIQGVMSI